MPLFASIDIGSNTLRLLIGAIAGGKIIATHTGRRITRLGSMVAHTGFLQTGAMEASIKALREFSSTIDRHGVAGIRALATSALREARNSALFMRRAREETGIGIEVISGEREAELTLKGVLHALAADDGRTSRPERPALPEGGADLSIRNPLFIMDIGGGSSEWIFYRGGEMTSMGSLPAGVLKLAQKYITSDPVSESDLDRLNREILSACAVLETEAKGIDPEAALFIGTGGTFTTIASVDLGLAGYSRDKIHMHRIPLERLLNIQKTFLGLPLKEREKIRGLEPERADLIIPGLQFTMMVMKSLGFRGLIISDYGLLEGALLEMKEAIEESFPEAGKP